jgi:hypothetical protein
MSSPQKSFATHSEAFMYVTGLGFASWGERRSRVGEFDTGPPYLVFEFRRRDGMRAIIYSVSRSSEGTVVFFDRRGLRVTVEDV